MPQHSDMSLKGSLGPEEASKGNWGARRQINCMRRADSGGYALRGSRSAAGSNNNSSSNAPVRGGAVAAGGVAVTRHRRVKQELQDDQKKELKEAFELFDAEKNGNIDYHELKASALITCRDVVGMCLCADYVAVVLQVLMRALGFQVKKREVLELVEEVDINRSGRVEFSDYMEISTLMLPLSGDDSYTS